MLWVEGHDEVLLERVMMWCYGQRVMMRCNG